ncbi:MAG: penicillin-binding transpeptidase domain-containing protein, partial [Bryobacteraceae bacterium]
VKAQHDSNPRIWELQAANVQKVTNGLFAVVNEGGTGGRARIPGLEVCGKTGTAQLASAEFAKSSKGAHLKDNAWFVGFANRENPEIVVAALFEGGEHGHFAAPIVRDVIKAYFDKKARLGVKNRPAPPAPAATPPEAKPAEEPKPITRTPAAPPEPKPVPLAEIRDRQATASHS